MSFISSSYDEGEIVIPTVSETDHRLVQDLYDKVKGTKHMKIIDFIFYGNTFGLYLGEDNCNDYWGDEWDDTPYEHNAGRVYEKYIKGYVEFAFPLKYSVCEVCTGYLNSPFSKEDMKNREVPCLTISAEPETEIYFRVYFGDNIDEISKKITELGGFKIFEMRNKEE